MKYKRYKKQIVTGVLALSLLAGGSTVYADTSRNIGIKDVWQVQLREGKKYRKSNLYKRGIVGTVLSLTNTGFIIESKNIKTGAITSLEIRVDNFTIYRENGIKVGISDIVSGEKVVVVGTLDKTANILMAKRVKIIQKA